MLPVASAFFLTSALALAMPFSHNATGEEDRLHPGFDLMPIRPKGFEPKVSGMEFLPGGRLAIATWHPNELWILSGYDGPLKAMKAVRAQAGFKELMGLCVLGDTIFAADQDSIYVLRDRDGDGLPEARAGIGALPWTGSFHEWSFGLVNSGGRFHTGLSVAASQTGKTLSPQKDARRGGLAAMDREGKLEIVAGGLRAPDGLCLGPDSGIFATDNQGSWLPASKFVHLESGKSYGHHTKPAGAFDEAYPAPPAVWLPYGTVSKSPTQPIWIRSGAYAGQFLFGDIAFGVVRRVALEKVADRWQGCVLHFSGGFEAGVHRMLAGPDGSIYLGGLGNGDIQNWGWRGYTTGLQRMKPNGRAVFEILAVHAMKGGYEIVFSAPSGAEALKPMSYRAEQWWYEPTESYGGKPKDVAKVAVKSVRASADGSRVFVEMDGLLPQQVTHVRLTGIRSRSGAELWTPDFWYTLNTIPERAFAP